jgi:hypothetical protein
LPRRGTGGRLSRRRIELSNRVEVYKEEIFTKIKMMANVRIGSIDPRNRQSRISPEPAKVAFVERHALSLWRENKELLVYLTQRDRLQPGLRGSLVNPGRMHPHA